MRRFRSSLAPLRARAHCAASDVFEQRLDVAVGELRHVLENEHQAANLFDELRVFLRQPLP